MKMEKCNICGKRAKENTEGNVRYCQGHSIFEVNEANNKKANKAFTENMRRNKKLDQKEGAVKLYNIVG